MGAGRQAGVGEAGAAKTANPAVRPTHGTAFATYAATRPGVSWTLRSPPHIASWRNTVEIHLLFPPTNHSKVAARTVLVAAFDALCIKSGVLYLDLDRTGGGRWQQKFQTPRRVSAGQCETLVFCVKISRICYPSPPLWQQIFLKLLPLHPPLHYLDDTILRAIWIFQKS